MKICSEKKADQLKTDSPSLDFSAFLDFTFRPSSGQIFNTQGENSKMIPKFSAPVFGTHNLIRQFSPRLKQPWGQMLMQMLMLLTQPLEVLHRALVTLQRRVGLGGLIQEHLQSCNATKGTKIISCFSLRELSPPWLALAGGGGTSRALS